MSEVDDSFDSFGSEPEKPQVVAKQRKVPIKLSREHIQYGKSRLKFRHHCTMTPTSILFKIDADKFKRGYVNKDVQIKPHVFGVSTQTEYSLSFLVKDVQVPDLDLLKKRFTSTLHFLKAASSTMNALLDLSEFSSVSSSNQPLTKVNKFVIKNPSAIILHVLTTATKTLALIEENDISKNMTSSSIYVWNARGSEPSSVLVSCAKATCFCLMNDGRYVVAGSSSGSVLIWDLMKESETSIQPLFSTDQLYKQMDCNHSLPVIAISSFGKSGSNLICTLDDSATACFWYMREDKVMLRPAGKVKLSVNLFPTFSLAISPTSVDTFIVGAGCNIWNCSRFDSIKVPNFQASAKIQSIQFSHIIPTLFSAASDNGRVAIYDVSESESLLDICVDISTSDLCICWSPTRASVLYVTSAGAMMIYVYDLLQDIRQPIYKQKIGNAARTIASSSTMNGVVLAIGQGDNTVNVFRVKQELSKPLDDNELETLKLKLYNSA